MKLKNKIALLAAGSVVVSAATVTLLAQAVLKTSLLEAHYISDKELLNSISSKIAAAVEDASGAPAESAVFYFDETARPRLRAKKTDGRRTKEISLDFLALWNELKPLTRKKIVFVTDTGGLLAAHNDESRVAARSDFSALEAVRMAGSGEKPSRAVVTSDEKNLRSVAVWADAPGGLLLFSLTPYDDVMRQAAAMTAKVTTYVFALTLAFVTVGVFFARKITTPLERLGKAAVDVARGRLDGIDLSDKRMAGADGEVAVLAANFAEMTSSLKKLAALRDDLVHMIVHDLKSPLSAIISSIEFLNSAKEAAPTEKQRKFLSLARSAGKNLMSLVEDLLDVAKLEEGKLVLRRSTVNIKNFLAGALRDFEPQAEAERKLLTLRCPDGASGVFDEALIRRVVVNLVSNALKHTKSDVGAIEVEAKAEGGGVEISVSDNGQGIPEDYRDRIFEKFVQAEGKRSQIRSGVGLGLTFCKMVVEAHGGCIAVASEESKGSSFIFRLPAGTS